MGMSPGEVAYLAVEEADSSGQWLVIDQADLRDIDARAKRGEQLLFDERPRHRKQRDYDERLRAIVPLLADVMSRTVPTLPADRIHRLDKFDTKAERPQSQGRSPLAKFRIPSCCMSGCSVDPMHPIVTPLRASSVG
jgi:hypothetical protein